MFFVVNVALIMSLGWVCITLISCVWLCDPRHTGLVLGAGIGILVLSLLMHARYIIQLYDISTFLLTCVSVISDLCWIVTSP